MNTITACSLLMITAALCTGCSESSESTEPPLNDTNPHEGSVYFDVTSMGTDNERYSSATVNVTNYTDHAVYHLRCDSFGYQFGVLVASESDQDMFPPQATSGIPDLEPGQTRSAQLIMDNESSDINVARVEWVCSYQEGDEFNLMMFEGSS